MDNTSPRWLRTTAFKVAIAALCTSVFCIQIERRDLRGVESPAAYMEYRLYGWHFATRQLPNDVVDAYRRLVGEPPACLRPVEASIQTLSINPFLWSLGTCDGRPVAVTYQRIGRLVADENRSLTDAAKRRLLLDFFSMADWDQTGLEWKEYMDELERRTQATTSSPVDVTEMPNIASRS